MAALDLLLLSNLCVLLMIHFRSTTLATFVNLNGYLSLSAFALLLLLVATGNLLVVEERGPNPDGVLHLQ